MLKFRQYLKEIFDKPHPYEKADTSHHLDSSGHLTTLHAYKFSPDKDTHVRVSIDHDKDTAYPTFDTNGRTGMTGKNPKNSHKILGTVKHIVKHHIDQNPHIKKVSFSNINAPRTLGQKKGREKLYTRLAKKHGGKSTVVDKYETKHEIPTGN